MSTAPPNPTATTATATATPTPTPNPNPSFNESPLFFEFVPKEEEYFYYLNNPECYHLPHNLITKCDVYGHKHLWELLSEIRPLVESGKKGLLWVLDSPRYEVERRPFEIRRSILGDEGHFRQFGRKSYIADSQGMALGYKTSHKYVIGRSRFKNAGAEDTEFVMTEYISEGNRLRAICVIRNAHPNICDAVSMEKKTAAALASKRNQLLTAVRAREERSTKSTKATKRELELQTALDQAEQDSQEVAGSLHRVTSGVFAAYKSMVDAVKRSQSQREREGAGDNNAVNGDLANPQEQEQEQQQHGNDNENADVYAENADVYPGNEDDNDDGDAVNDAYDDDDDDQQQQGVFVDDDDDDDHHHHHEVDDELLTSNTYNSIKSNDLGVEATTASSGQDPLGQKLSSRRVSSGPTQSKHEAYCCYVGNLAWTISDRELKYAFKKSHVVDAKVVMDRASGRSRGFGFVTFGDPTSMENAILAMDGVYLDGRKIKVDRAQPNQGRDRDGGRDWDRDRDGGRDRGRDHVGPRDSGDCFKCSKPGHFARDCPLVEKSRGGGGYIGRSYGGSGNGSRHGGHDRGRDCSSGRSRNYGGEGYYNDRSGPYERP